MTDNAKPMSPSGNEPMEVAVSQINSALVAYSDKDWNYSRITLTVRPLSSFDSAYFLRLEVLDLTTKSGRNELKTLVDEVKWGDRHSSELGILEVVSLRINKALLECTSDEFWEYKRAIIRIARKEELVGEQPTHAIWYQVTEVDGEDFDNR